jgi:hypothetical protein
MIKLRDALKLMECKDKKKTPVPFSIEFVTANRKKGTGGIITKKTGCILAKFNKKLPQYVRNADGGGKSHQPKHHSNQTRNIQLPEEGIVKVRIRLITQFNEMEIIW